MEDNIYLRQVHSALPRLMSLFDTDPYSITRGVGDRFYWGWKLIDFGNGTFQGAANGLARLLQSGLLPDSVSKNSIEKRIADIFSGTDYLRRSNGSMEEAFPYESSFCVTALVAYDLLTSMELQRAELSNEEWTSRLNVVAPMIKFLCKADEFHAFISNHLATAVSALYKWHILTDDLEAERRSLYFLDRILKNMSSEGWFKEYEGADPGYQTLCMYYLIDMYRMAPHLQLRDALGKAVKFLWHFAHPDGSFGGIYGSRNTRFYYPLACEYLKDEFPEAKVLAEFMRKSIGDLKTVTLTSMDEPNLIPMFNSYVWAATLMNRDNIKPQEEELKLPALMINQQQCDFPEAGLYIRGTNSHYTVISAKKGGVLAGFSRDGEKFNIDAGNVIEYKGQLYSTQINGDNNKKMTENKEVGCISIEVQPILMLRNIPKPWQFVILRILNTTLMRNKWMNEAIKKILVRMLITGKKEMKYSIIRTIFLRGDLPVVNTRWQDEQLSASLPNIEKPTKLFKSIHMASSGYWQRGDD